jgi:putative transposase
MDRDSWLGSFHINRDLAPLIDMIKTMSLTLSPQARQRLAWMDAYRECGNAAQVCRHFSIPLRTFWRWKRRYDPWDLKSLEDRSRRPRRSPRRTDPEAVQAVLALKREHPRWGREKLSLVLAQQGLHLCGKTCERICHRHALIVVYRTRKRRSPKPRVDWAAVRLPGDLFQLDTKHISYHGQRVYQYTLIDVVSRWRCVELFWSANMATTIQFLQFARQQWGRSMQMLQTDNGPEFGQSVTTWCRSQHIRHVFSHKRRPQENAYVERSHRTDEEEFYSLTSQAPTFQEFRLQLQAYLTIYNERRPHWALGGKTPREALESYSLKPCHMS